MKYDAKQAQYESMQKAIAVLKKKKIPCTPIALSDEYGAMHHKFAVIDRQTVLTGSYNLTSAASIANYENLIRVDSPEIASQYRTEFLAIKSH